MRSTIWDSIDLFNTQFTFSNRVSTKSGKIATYLYLGFFLYLSFSALLSAFSRTYMNISTQQTLNLQFMTDSNYYKKLHVILSIGVYPIDNSEVADPEEILREFFNFKLSYISSNCMSYKILNFYENKILQSNNLLTYFTTYDINTLNDFMKISVDKTVLKSQDDIVKFFQTYTLKFHVDYYFLKNNEKFISQTQDLYSMLNEENELFQNYGLIDYLYRTKNQDYIVMNSNNYMSNKNVIYSFNPYVLSFDQNIILTDAHQFKAFNLESRSVDEYANNLASFLFKLSSMTHSYTFSYKKISTYFAEIAGIMNLLKFLLYICFIVITFVKRNQLFFYELYYDEIAVENYSGKSLIKEQQKSPKKLNLQMSERGISKTTENKRNEYKANRRNSPMKRSEDIVINHQSGSADFDFMKNSASPTMVHRQPSRNSSMRSTFTLAEPSNKRIFKLNDKMDIVELPNNNRVNLEDRSLLYKGKITSSLLKKYGNESRKISYSCSRVFFITIFGCCGKSKLSQLKRKIILKFYQKNMEKMDIIWVQNQLKYVDLLGYVLLEPRQRVLLEYSKKEQLLFNYKTNEANFINDYSLSKSTKDHVEILRSYDNQSLDDRDLRIFNILDPRIKCHLRLNNSSEN